MKKTKKESFIQGVLALMFSQVIIKILGLVYSMYLTNREGFGDSGNAIYMGGYQIYALLLTLSSIGVPNAISKLIAERLARGDKKGADRVFKIAFATFAVIGFIGTLILFCGARVIATYWLTIPECEYTLIALSPAIFFVSISSVIRGYFNGNECVIAIAHNPSAYYCASFPFKSAFTFSSSGYSFGNSTAPRPAPKIVEIMMRNPDEIQANIGIYVKTQFIPTAIKMIFNTFAESLAVGMIKAINIPYKAIPNAF